MITLDQIQPNAALRVPGLFLKVHALLAASPWADLWKKVGR